MSNIPPREIILAKAGELFHRKGYSAVSVDEIIAASGLPKAEFHRAFSGKSATGAGLVGAFDKAYADYARDVYGTAGRA